MLAEKASAQHTSSPSAVLYFDHAFSAAPDILDPSAEQLSRYLSRLSAYVHLLHSILIGDCCTNHTAQKLLGYIRGSGSDYIVPEYALLYAAARSSGQGATSKTVGQSALGTLVRQVIGRKMKDRITQEIRRCRDVRVLTDTSIDTVRHPSPKMYAARIRILCQQIVTYDCMRSLPRELLETQVQGQQQRYVCPYSGFHASQL